MHVHVGLGRELGFSACKARMLTTTPFGLMTSQAIKKYNYYPKSYYLSYGWEVKKYKFHLILKEMTLGMTKASLRALTYPHGSLLDVTRPSVC